jgi:large subunit ribosomal protein L23
MATTSPQYFDILKSPRITEKGAISAEHNAYIFNVHPRATKALIKKAIEAIYKVVPMKVTIVTIAPKKMFTKGKTGATAKGKKAYVFLKKGEQIQVI